MAIIWQKRLCISCISVIATGVSAAPLDLATSPLPVSTAVSPNVMLLLDNSGSMGSYTGEGISRMQTVKNVAKSVIADNPGMDFGLAVLGQWQGTSRKSSTQGGTVLKACEDRTAENPNSSNSGYAGSIYQSIDRLSAETWTPLAEALYEVTRYYRGLPTSYSSTTFPAGSPIKYRCQQNFTIVLTDGYPTYDKDIPAGGDPDDIADTNHALPNWDGNAANDGRQRASYENNSSEFQFLDDVALFAHDIDFKKSGVDLAGKSFNDPDFRVQNMSTYTVGFEIDDPMLSDAAGYGEGEYYLANNTTSLAQKLTDALNSIAARSGSSSSAAANTGRLRAGSHVYQARFDSTGWKGQLLAFAIGADRSDLITYGKVLETGSADRGAVWDARDQMPGWSSRSIFTNDTDGVSGGQRFRWGGFTSSEKADYFDSDQGMLQYLRGREDDEVFPRFRQRGVVAGKVLGDIVHSTPYYVGKPAARYSDSLESKPYSAFISDNASRLPIVYVGANDGMLHGFDAETGREKVAFIPNKVLPDLKKLTKDNYSHQFYVDGSPTVVDAYVDEDWRTVLAGGLNLGGQSIYALNITDPDKFSESDENASHLFMWEFTDNDDSELGFTYSRPHIVKLKDGKWYAVFGNGYNSTVNDGHASTTGDAVVFIVDLEDKSNYYKLSTGVGMAEDPMGINRPNGFGSITPIDKNGDVITDAIYAGDLFGNVWKFSLDDIDPANWGVEYKLFETCYPDCASSTRQPITAGLTVGRAKSGMGVMVYFGTGKYLEVEDNNGAAGGVQTFYALHDKGGYTVVGSTPVIAGRSMLLEQTVTNEAEFQINVDELGTPDDTDDDVATAFELRETSNNYATSNTDGWFMDLSYGAATGERVVSKPALRGDQVVFVTNIPTSDPCSPGGDSWVMKLDAFSGKRLTHTYDLNDDGRFSDIDRPTGGGATASTGIKVNSGNSPSFMPDGDADKILISTNNGIKILDSYLGQQINRQSWQQITR